MFVDFINIGYRIDSNAGAVGTMLMWKNLTALYQEAAEKQLLFITPTVRCPETIKTAGAIRLITAGSSSD
ncbi:hypothetical protein WDV93_07530 [Pantoea ananatis]